MNNIIGQKFRYKSVYSNTGFDRIISKINPSSITIKQIEKGYDFTVYSESDVRYKHYEIEIDFIHKKRKRRLKQLGINGKEE